MIYSTYILNYTIKMSRSIKKMLIPTMAFILVYATMMTPSTGAQESSPKAESTEKEGSSGGILEEGIGEIEFLDPEVQECQILEGSGENTATSNVIDNSSTETAKMVGSEVGSIGGFSGEQGTPSGSEGGGRGHSGQSHNILQEKYYDFLEMMNEGGMPTGFLREIYHDYTIYEGLLGSQSTYPYLDIINFDAGTLDGALDPSLRAPPLSSIEVIYHESTHAYFDIHGDDLNFANAMRDGEIYYTNAPLKNGEIASNPMVLVMEAAGEYAGHRAMEYYSALERLSKAADGEIPRDQLQKWIDDTRKQYEKAMQGKVFGTQLSNGIPTTKPINPELKALVDNKILEGKIPDLFDKVNAFNKLIKQAYSFLICE